MELINQITKMCKESGNDWFLEHVFPKIALYDLKLQERIHNFDERSCTCNNEKKCQTCKIEITRTKDLEKLKIPKIVIGCSDIYDYNDEKYVQSKWIFPPKIDNELPGFMLIKCAGSKEFKDQSFTHEIYFAFVKPKYRQRKILKNMVNCLPKEWKIWLEASNTEIDNIENIWQKCGFSFFQSFNACQTKHVIYCKI